MEIKVLDFRGLKCPQPSLKLNAYWMKEKPKPGETIEVIADCPTFPTDVKNWAVAAKKVIIFSKQEGTAVRVRIQF